MNYLFKKMVLDGVVHRNEVKNHLSDLNHLLRRGYAKKTRMKKRVFFELTPKALPLLDEYRKILLHQATLQKELNPHSIFYRALLEDLRFLDENKQGARQFLFLGDWQLKRPPSFFQLKLAQERFYEKN